MLNKVATVALGLWAVAASAQYTATYLPTNAPNHSESGQRGGNHCGTKNNQTSMCQNVYVNSVTDFCLWAPPYAKYGKGDTIGASERYEVAWCLKDGYGTRTIPPGTIKAAHFVQTPDYAQITGYGDFTKMNVAKGDEGGELDPHGADGKGNPIGGLVFGKSYGKLQQYHEWTNFMSATEFCIRVCPDKNPKRTKYCQHIYDVMGCYWNMPGNYNAGFTTCEGDSTEPMGIYGTSTWYQGHKPTPSAHKAGKSSKCSTLKTLPTTKTKKRMDLDLEN
jgi:hypothetical protein